jgi:hypothetical protein
MSLDQLRARFARNVGLPFADVLTEARIRDDGAIARSWRAPVASESSNRIPPLPEQTLRR